MTFKDIFTKSFLKTTKHPRITLCLLFGLTIIAFFFCQKLHIDTSVTALIMKDNPDYLFFKQWQNQFGTDEFIIAAFESKNGIFQPSVLKIIKKATEQIEALPYVRRVISLSNTVDVRTEGEDLVVEPLYTEVPQGLYALKKIRKEALENPLFVKNLISPDGKATAIFIELEDLPRKDKYRQETIEGVKKVFTHLGLKKIFLTGKTVRDCALALYMQKDLKTFLPISLSLIILILYLIFRSFWGILSPLAVILSSLIWTVAGLYLIGGSMNNVTTVLPPVIIALSISDAVHLLSEYLQELPLKPAPAALQNTISQLISPCFLTSTTTMAGFASLYVSKIPAIRELGLSATLGIGIAFLLTFILLPNILVLRPFPSRYRQTLHLNSHPFMDRFLLKLTKFNVAHPGMILGASSVIMIMSFWAIFHLKVETNLINFFKREAPIYRATLFVEKHISGTQILEISLKGEKRDLFKDPAILGRVEALQTYLRHIPKVDRTISLVDFLKKTNQAFHNNNPLYYRLPQSKPLISQYLLLYDESDLKSFVNSEYNWATVQVRLSEHSSSKTKKIIGQIRSYLKRKFPDLKARITGNPVLEADIIDTMVNSQVSSLGLAMVIIFGMMFLLFRSLSVGLISIVPNVFPIFVNFGIMGLWGIPLSTATSMISAIAIGIVVDDTIHFLHTFGYCLSQTSGDYQKALFETIKIKGEAIVFTSVILALGFGVLIFSNFVPTKHFGYLTTLIMFTALIGDLLILPALLITFKPRFANEGRKG